MTFYFGVILFALSALFLVLTIKFGTSFTFSDFFNWLNAHAAILLVLATLVLSAVLTTSGIAYKKVAKMSKEDYAIWLQMRSTKTLFPFFTPLHDWLRMRVSIYRWWHTQTYSSPLHTIILIGVMIFAFRTVSSNVIVSSGGSGNGCLYTYNVEPGMFIGRAYGVNCDYFTITGSPTAAGTAGTIVVTEYTGGGAVNTAYNGTAHFTSTDGQAIFPADYTFTGGDAGVHTFTNGLTFKTSGNQTINVTDVAKTQITGGQTVTISPGSASTITLSNLPASVVSGTAMTAIVTAKDAYSNIATAYTGTIHFTSSDGSATLPGNYTFVGGDAGVHTFTNGVTLVTTGSKTVTVTDVGNGSLTSTNTITVTATTISGSGPITFTTCADVAGNTAWTSPGNATATDASLATNVFTSSSPTVTYDAASNGTGTGATVTVSHTVSSNTNRLLIVGVTGFDISMSGVTYNGVAMTLVTGGTKTVFTTIPDDWNEEDLYYLVNPASGTHNIVATQVAGATLAVGGISFYNVSQSTPLGTAVTSGSRVSATPLTVTASAATGDMVVDVAGSNGGTLTSNTTQRWVNGQGHGSTAAGAASVTMSYAATTAPLQGIVAVPVKQVGTTISTADYIKCTQLATPIPTNATVTGITIVNDRKSSVGSTISDLNMYLVKGGTIQTGWTNKASATLWPTGLTNATYGGSADMWGGTLTASDVNGSGFGVALQPQSTGAATASIDSLTGTINYTTPATTSFTVTTSPSSTTAGTAISTTVTAKDAGGTTNVAYTGIVHFTSSDSQAVLPSNYTFVSGDAGVHTFTNGVTLKTAGTKTVVATDTVTASITGSANVTVTAATASTLTVAPTSTSVVTFDAASHGTGSGTSITVSHVVGTGSNRILVVGVAESGATNTVTGVTYNGTAMTLVPSSVSTGTNAGTNRTTALYYLVAPSTGTHNIVVSASSGLLEAGGTSWSGVSQTAPIGTAAIGNASNGTSVSTNVTSATGQVVVDVGASAAGASTSFATTQTSRWVDTTVNSGMSSAAGAGSVTMGYTDSSSAPMSISAVPLLPDKTTAVSSINAGTAFNVVVTALDAYSNVATGYTGIATFTSTDSQAVLPSNYTFVGGDNGVHTFSGGVTLKTAGTKTVTATDTVTGSITGTSSSITVLAESASTFAFSSTPTTATAGTPFSTTVTATDAYGNIAIYYTGIAHFTSTDSQAVLPSNYTFVGGDNGVHTFTNGVTLKTAGTQTITVTDTITGSITATSAGITVSPSTVSSLATTGNPTSVTAGTAFSETITAKDAYSNTVTSYTGTIHFTSTDSQAVLPSNYTFVGGDSGTHTFTNAITLKTSGSKTVTATDIGNGALTTTVNITVNAGAVSKYVFTSTPGSSTAGTAFSGTLNAEDANNNIVSTYTGTTHFTSSDSQAVLPSNYTFVGGDGGTHTFTNGFNLKTSGSQTITATDNGNGSISGIATVVVSAASASQFVISTVGSATAGTAFSLTNTIKDAYSNVVTGYSGTVHFTSTDSQAILPADYTYVPGDSGAHIFTNAITLKTAGSKSVTVTDTGNGSLTTSATITVSNATLDHLALSLSPSSTVAGTAFSGTLSAKDVYGNNVTSYTGTIHFTGTGGNSTVLPSNYTFVGGDAGVHIFTNAFTFFTAFTNTVTATETSPGVLTVSANEVVTPGPATHFGFGIYPVSVTAGSPFTLALIAIDVNGNTDTNYTGTAHFTSTDSQAVLPTDHTFTGGDAGIYNFPAGSFTLKTVGSKTITATDTVTSSITGTTANITVSAASASAITFSSVPGSTTAGSSFSGIVTATDTYGNVAAGYTGTVNFVSSDSQAVLPASYTFVGGDNGAHTFTNGFSLKTVGSKTITVTDTINNSLTSTATVTVNPASAATLVISSAPASVTAGTTFSMTVTAKDAYSNIATGYTGTIAFTSGDSQAVLPSNYTFVGGDSGTHTFTNTLTLKTVGVQTVTITDSGNSLTTSTDITVNVASTSQLVISTVGSTTAGSSFSLTATLKDTYGNTETGYSGTIHFTSGDSQAALPSNYTFVGGDSGAHTFTNALALKTAGSQSVTVAETAPGILTTTANITVIHNTASSMSLTMAQSTVTAGSTDTPTVSVYDAYGNLVTNYASTITFSSDDSLATLPSSYNFVGGDGGTHSFANGITLKTAGNKTVSVADDQPMPGTLLASAMVTVNPASASQYSISSVPSSPVAGSIFSPTLTAKDQYSNIATSYTGTAHFTSSDSQAVLPSNYTFIGGDAGVHTFTGQFSLKTTGSQTVVATDTVTNTITVTATATVIAGNAGGLSISSTPSTVTAGAAFSTTVTVRDSNGNVATSYTGTVNFTSNDGQAVLPSNYTFVGGDAGIHLFSNSITLKTAGSKTFTVTDIADGTLKDTATVNVNPAAASAILSSNTPTTVVAGVAFSTTLTIKDAYNNTVTTYAGTLHFTSDDTNAILPINHTFIGGDAGVHTFTNGFVLKTAGTKHFTATDTINNLLTVTDALTVSDSNATQIIFSSTPSSITAGTVFSSTLTIEDAFGNVMAGYTGTIHFTSSDPQPTLPTDYAFVGGDAGVHTFTNGFVLKTAGNQNIVATDANNPGLTNSTTVVVGVAPAGQIVVSTVASTTAGSPFSLTATVKDAYNNTVSGYSGTLHMSSADSQAVLPSNYTFVGGDAGVHTFTNGVTLKTAGSQSITVAETAPGILSTAVSVDVSSSTASQIVFSGFPSTVTAGSLFSGTVSIKDLYDNVVTGYTGQLHFSTSGSGVMPADYTYTLTDAGTHIFSSAFAINTAGTQSILTTEISSTPLFNYLNITVNPAAATQYTLSMYPSSVTAGQQFTVRVDALDPYLNKATGYTGTVNFTSSDSAATLPADYTFVGGDAGAHIFTNGFTYRTSGQQTLTATDTVNNGIHSSASIQVDPNSTTRLVIGQTPSSVTAGSAFSTTVTAEDAFGNVASGYAGTIHFVSSDGLAVLPSDYNYVVGDAGVHTFNGLVLATAGSKTITVSDTQPTQSGPTPATITVVVNPGTATALKLSNYPVSTVAGASLSTTATVQDANGNTVTGYTGTIIFTTSDRNGSLPSNYTFVGGDAGVHTFTDGITLRTSGDQTVTAIDSNDRSLSDTASIVVSPAVAISYQVTGPALATVNTPFSVTLDVKDAYGNNVSNYQGTVHFTSTDGLATLPTNYTFTPGDSGSHIFASGINMHTAGNQTVTLTDTNDSSLTVSLSLTVSSGVANRIVFGSTPVTIAAGSPITTSLTIEDIDGNRVINYTGTVHFTSDDLSATLPADYTFISGDAGTHNFVNGFSFTTVGGKTVTATDSNNSNLVTSFATTVIAGSATQFIFGTVPAISIASTTFSPTITVKDVYDNIVTNFTDKVHFSSTDSSAILPSDYTFTSNDAGVHIFTGLFTLKTVGNQTITAVGANTTDKDATGSAAVNVVAGDASQLVISQTPSSTVAGSAFSAVVTIHDSNGSVATSYTGTVAFSSNDPQAVLPSNYTFTSNDAGVHTFTNLFNFKSAGLRTLTATDTTNTNLSNTAQIIVEATTATQLVAKAPVSTTSGAPFTVTITAEDAYGNIITNYAGAINFGSSDSKAALPALYIFTGIDRGSHTFTNGFTLSTSGKQTITAAEFTSRGSGIPVLSVTISLNVTANAPSLPPLLPPTVKVLSPANGSTISGTFTETADASSSDGIKNVQLLVDSTIVTITTSQPYQTSIDSTKLTSGSHVIAAIATANSGLSANDHVTIIVSNSTVITNPSPNTPPVVTPSTPSKLPVAVQRAADTSSVVSAVVAFASFAPTASIVTTAISTGAVQGVSIFNLPFLGLGRRKRRKNWGLVKNSLTGLPISGVFVELWSVSRPEILAKTLTDNSGQFAFIVDKPGQFHLRIDNPLYKTYDSGIVTVTDPKTDLVRREIILEPIEKIMQARLQKALRLIRFTEYLYILHWPLLVAGSVLSILVLYDKFTVGRLIMVIIYGAMWISKLFQAKYQRPFGVVVDNATERPQELSIVQLTTKDTDSTQQVIRSTITDSHGRFLFVVKPDKYNLVAAKAGFRPEEKEVKGDNINMDVRLKWDEKDDKL